MSAYKTSVNQCVQGDIAGKVTSARVAFDSGVWYTERMTLAEATPVRTYRILHLEVENEGAHATRLRQLGFVPDMQFVCEAVAPLIKNPYLVRIRGINVALTRHEALMISVVEVNA